MAPGLFEPDLQEPLLAVELSKMAGDPDDKVRLQLACTLGEWNDARAGDIIGQLLLKDSANIYITSGAYSSINDKNLDSVVRAVMSGGKEHPAPQEVIATLLKIGIGLGNARATTTLLATVTQGDNGKYSSAQFASLAGLLDALASTLTLAGMVAVMFYLNWRFTLIALSVAPLLFFVVYFYTRRIKKASREARKKDSQIVSLVQEVFSSIRVVKAFGRETYEEDRLEEQSLEGIEIAMRARGLKAKLAPLVDVIVAVGTCLVLWFGARMALAGSLSPGSLVVFILYLGKMYKPMQALSKMTDTYSKAEVGYERISEVLATDNQVANLPGARRAPRLKGKIEFDKVSFHYAPDQPILKDLSFIAEPGQLVAFVGPTGAGKTSLISLIPRFYDPVSGVVKLDDRDIRSFTLESIRSQISFVLQETLLFHGPVWKNIAYGKPDASRAEILHAAEIALAHEFIEKMPEGYNTIVGERGVTLSGGQRQRIAIARAVIRNTPIMILDEPSAGLDAESEKLVFEALDRLMEGKTSLVIAHRLSTIQRADMIFVVQDGTIVQSGKHDELMKAGGLYAEFYALQIKASSIP